MAVDLRSRESIDLRGGSEMRDETRVRGGQHGIACCRGIGGGKVCVHRKRRSEGHAETPERLGKAHAEQAEFGIFPECIRDGWEDVHTERVEARLFDIRLAMMR